MKMVRQWRYLLLATLAIVALAAVAACSSSDDSTSTPTPKGSGSPAASGPPADAAPDAQQLLTINLGAEPSTIDPQAQSYTYEATVVNNTFLTLFDQDPTTSQLTPNAASAVPSRRTAASARTGSRTPSSSSPA